MSRRSIGDSAGTNRPGWLCVLLGVFLAAVSAPAGASEADSTVYSPAMTHADSVAAWQESRDPDTALDIAGEVTAQVLYFPFRIVFTGLREGARYVNETQIVPRIDDFLSADDGTWRFVPLASPTDGLGMKFKIERDPYVEDPDGEISIAAAAWRYGLQTYRLEVEDWPLLGLDQPWLRAGALAQFQLQPEEHFYGTGMATTPGDQRYYKQERSQIGLNLFLYPHRTVALTGGVRYDNTLLHGSVRQPSLDFHTLPPYKFSNPNWVAGYDYAIEMLHSSIGIEWNTAINRARPMNAWVLDVAGGHHQEINAGKSEYLPEFGYQDLQVRFGRYTHLFMDRVLYIDVSGHFTEPLENGVIPFYDLPELGGSDTMRGFKRGRYAGEHTVAGTVEWRFPLRSIWDESGLDFAFFADWGKVVQDDVSDWDMDGVAMGWGFSLQTWTLEGSAARLDVGFSHEGTRLYFTMGL